MKKIYSEYKWGWVGAIIGSIAGYNYTHDSYIINNQIITTPFGITILYAIAYGILGFFAGWIINSIYRRFK